jgi:hypothetical protein
MTFGCDGAVAGLNQHAICIMDKGVREPGREAVARDTSFIFL